MRKILKWVGIVLGGLLALVVVTVLVGAALGSARLNKTYSVPQETVQVPTDQASLELGQHWAKVFCEECHAEDLGGEIFFDDPVIGTFPGPNLTTGEGGASAEMTDAELATAIRHAVDHDGTGLVIMPSGGFYFFSDEDLGAILAYLRHAPPVDREQPEASLTLIGRALIGLGLFGNVSMAEVIDHTAPRPAAPAPGITLEYGTYLARVGDCHTCHGDDLNGGRSPDPISPPAPNLTPGGHLGEWTEADFFHAMRNGIEPDGEEISEVFMPWKGIGQMTDAELSAMWMYLQSLPALEDAVEGDE